MATLTAQSPKRQANAISMVSADTNGDAWNNTGKEVLLVENTSAGTVTLTFVTYATVDGLAVDDLQISVPAGETHLIGPFPTEVYNDANGQAGVNYSSAAGVNVALLTLK